MRATNNEENYISYEVIDVKNHNPKKHVNGKVLKNNTDVGKQISKLTLSLINRFKAKEGVFEIKIDNKVVGITNKPKEEDYNV